MFIFIKGFINARRARLGDGSFVIARSRSIRFAGVADPGLFESGAVASDQGKANSAKHGMILEKRENMTKAILDKTAQWIINIMILKAGEPPAV